MHFLLSTGCRIAEACALNREDLRLEGFRVLGKGGMNPIQLQRILGHQSLEMISQV